VVNVKIQYYAVIVLLLALVVGTAAAGESVPIFPQEFWGGVMINDSPAPAGTVIVAMIGNTESGSVKTTQSGKYGGDNWVEGNHLIVRGSRDQIGETVTFLINGQAAKETATFASENVTSLDLSADIAVTPTATSTHSSGGGGGGSSGSPSTQTTTTTTTTTTPYTGQASIATSASGKVTESVTAGTIDGAASVTIPSGTTAHDRYDKPLSEVTIKTLDKANLPGIEAENTIYLALDCGPDGATFDPAISLTFTLTSKEWADIDDPATLTVMWYNADTKKWQEIPATVDSTTYTITAQVSHFSTYALGWSSVQAEVTAPTGQQGVEKETVLPEKTELADEGIFGPIFGVSVIIIIGAVIGGVLYHRKKN